MHTANPTSSVTSSPFRSALVLIAMALLTGSGWAQDAASADDDPQLVEASCFADVDSIAPGASFRIACELEMAPHWHIYWKDPGESGAATSMKIETPTGFTLGALEWPRPQVLDADGSRCHGYEGSVILFAAVTAPEVLTGDDVAVFTIDLRWLVCRDVCVMGRDRQQITLPTGVDDAGASAPGAEETAGVAEQRARLETMARRVPRAATPEADCVSESNGARVIATGPALGHQSAELILIDVPGITVDAPTLSVGDGRWRLEAACAVDPGNLLGGKPRFAAVVALGETLDDPSFEISCPLAVPKPR